MYSVVDGSFDVLEDVGGAASEDDGGQFAVGSVALEDHQLFRGDFFNSDVVGSSHLVGGGGLQLGENGGSDSTGNSSEFELAEDFHGHDFVLVEEVEDDVGDGASGDDDVDVGVDQFLDELLSEVLLALGVVEEFGGVLDEDGALGVGLHGVEGAGVDGDAGLDHAVDAALHVALYQEPAEEGGVVDAGPQDVHHPDVVDVEVLGDVGQTVDAGFAHQVTEELRVVGDLGGDGGVDSLGNLVDVAGVVDFEDGQLLLVEEGERLLGGFLVADDDLAGVQSHPDQVLSVAQQFSCESYSEVCGISALLFLHLAGEDEHLGGGVLHFQLNRTVCTSLRMVAASEVTKVLSIWFTTIFFRAE